MFIFKKEKIQFLKQGLRKVRSSRVLTATAVAVLFALIGVGYLVFGHADSTTTLTMYRLFNGTDHFYTTSAPEAWNAVATYGYHLEGTYPMAYELGQPSIPVYRMNNGTDHYYTTNATTTWDTVASGAYKFEGIAFYTYGTTGTPGPAPPAGYCRQTWYQLFNGTDHFYTPDPAEAWNAAAHDGYKLQDADAFTTDVPPPCTSATSNQTLYRMTNGNDSLLTTNATTTWNDVASGAYKLVATYPVDYDVGQPALPVYQLYNGSIHFYSTDPVQVWNLAASGAYTFQGIAFYSYGTSGTAGPTPASGYCREPWYEMYNSASYRYTPNAVETYDTVASGAYKLLTADAFTTDQPCNTPRPVTLGKAKVPSSALEISASPTTLMLGQSTTISWHATGVFGSCVGSGDLGSGKWSGSVANSGSFTTGALTTSGSKVYVLTCSCTPTLGTGCLSPETTGVEVNVLSQNSKGPLPPSTGKLPPNYPSQNAVPNNTDPTSPYYDADSGTTAQGPAQALAAINAARLALEGMPPLALTSGNLPTFMSLTVPEQLFVLTNLERTSRGLTPIPAMTNQLNVAAQAGAVNDNDPVLSGNTPILTGGVSTEGTWASNWAGGQTSALGADFDWMYNDGLGSGNLACTPTDKSGCWGHRHNILYNYTANAGCSNASTYMGGGYVASDPTNITSFSELFARGCGSPTDQVFTWTTAKNMLKI